MPCPPSGVRAANTRLSLPPARAEPMPVDDLPMPDSACDIGCNATGRRVLSASADRLFGVVRPVTDQMIEAGLMVWSDAPYSMPLPDVLATVYRAMHTARPLSEGPV